MLIRRAEDVEPRTMDMPGAEGVKMRLMVGREDGAPTFAMRIFEVEPGGHTPRHHHNYEHEVMILDGQADVFDGAGGLERRVQSGDVLMIPANQEHQFQNAGDGTLRFMCLVPTQFDCGGGACEPTPGS